MSRRRGADDRASGRATSEGEVARHRGADAGDEGPRPPPHAAHTRSRRGLFLRLAGLAIVPLLLGASPTLAAPAKRPALTQVLRGEALERYEAAREDFKSQRFQQALTGFVRAYALSKEPRLRWNAAACLRKLERNAEALRAVDAYLNEAERELTPEELEEARRAADALRQLVTIAIISVEPADAQVSIDGTPLEAAGAEVYLEPGRHAFLAEKPGFRQQVRQEAVRAGERFSWSVTLVPLGAEATPRLEPVAASSTPPPAFVAVAPAPPPPSRPRWAPWAVAGGGAAAAALGGLLLGTSAATFARLRGECGIVCAPARWTGARDAELAGVVLVATGSALAAAGLGWGLWWTLDGAKAQLALGPTTVRLEVRF